MTICGGWPVRSKAPGDFEGRTANHSMRERDARFRVSFWRVFMAVCWEPELAGCRNMSVKPRILDNASNDLEDLRSSIWSRRNG